MKLPNDEASIFTASQSSQGLALNRISFVESELELGLQPKQYSPACFSIKTQLISIMYNRQLSQIQSIIQILIYNVSKET